MGYRGIEGTSIGANFELESPPADMKCPELPDHGGHNFWKSSCDIKQTMPEHHNTCYPHCKGGVNTRRVYEGKQQDRTIGQKERTRYATQLAEKICQLYKNGKTINEIAEIICRTPKLVSLRLNEAGLTNHNKGPTKKELVFEEWKTNPYLSDDYMRKKYTLTRYTIESYRRDFRRKNNIIISVRGSVFRWLKENPQATVEEVMLKFDLKPSTASSYHSQFNK